MLPILAMAAPPALVHVAEESSRPQGVLMEFREWVIRESARGVPFPNPWSPPSAADLPGTTVIVWGNLPPLETETQEVLRLTVAWMIANRFHGRPYAAMGAAPPAIPTGSWLISHPGGNRVPGSVPLGWRRWE